MSVIQTHNKAFKAEWLKLKHSGIFWLCFGSALFLPLLNTIISFFIDLNRGREEVNLWSSFIQSNFTGFAGFFFPVFLVLLVVRLVYLEHRSDTWKLLETQPVHKFALFIAKWETAALLSLLCLCGVLLFSLLGGLALQVFKPSSNLGKHSIEWGPTFAVLLRYWIASFAIISIQYFWSLLIKSFAWPMGIGLIGTITGGIFAGFGVAKWWPYSTTALTSTTYNGSITGNFLMQHEILSLVWTVLLIWIGYEFYKSKTFKRAFLQPITKLAAFGVFIIAFALTVWYINRPKALEPYGKTVLAGKIESKNAINNVVLLQAPAMDTVLMGPVKDNKFHITGDKTIDPGIYYLRAGTYRTQVFFSSGDSLFIDLSLKEKYNNEKISGTRIAENEFLRTGPRSDFWMLTDYAYTQKPGDYAQNALSSWRDGIADIQKFKTADNIKPRADFVAAQKKLLALKINGLLQNYYPGVFSIYYPNEILKYPKSVERIAKEADVKDNSLAGYPQYRAYITETYRTKSGRNDSVYLNYLNTELQPGKAKNYVLFEAVQNDVFRIRDSVRRTQLLHQFLISITDDKLKTLLVQKNANLQSLQRGKKAGNFLAEAINNADFDLSKLANRYVVLDVWATWCQPCKKEAPFFEDLAERYTNEQLAFVSLSVDEDKNAWKMEASNKKGRVLQLWAKNAEEDFAKKYALATIPRFILIDWKGNIVNAEMPYPSDPEFEAILQKEIPFLRN